MKCTPLATIAVVLLATGSARAADLGKSGFVDSDGVKLHYVVAGEGPLLVLLHGFPDYHYTWRDQIPALAKHFQVVALDLRGYNKSDKPEGVDNYKVEKLSKTAEVVSQRGLQPEVP
jgi:pimeloyl-ACP methyl ester carboxylesterase